MGENKAFLDFNGQTLLDRALSVLRATCGYVAIVGDSATFANAGQVVADVYQNCGPLGGIHAALTHSMAELNVMLAVDMPFVTPPLITFLLAQAEASGAVITVPRTRAGIQPLCAVYKRSFALGAEQALRNGKYKIDAAFATVQVHTIDELELAAAGFSETCFFNVNTPEDLRTADTLSSQA